MEPSGLVYKDQDKTHPLVPSLRTARSAVGDNSNDRLVKRLRLTGAASCSRPRVLTFAIMNHGKGAAAPAHMNEKLSALEQSARH